MPVYRKISAASTNQEVVKDSPGQIDGWYIVNRSDFFRFVKLFNTDSNPTLSVATPKITIGIPMRSAANVAFDFPLAFDVGICIAIVSGIPIGATGAVALNDVAVNLLYT